MEAFPNGKTWTVPTHWRARGRTRSRIRRRAGRLTLRVWTIWREIKTTWFERALWNDYPA